MKTLEEITNAIYDKYFENLIGCCEPAFNELKEDHKLRLIDSTTAGINILKQNMFVTNLHNEILRSLNIQQDDLHRDAVKRVIEAWFEAVEERYNLHEDD